VHTSSFDFSEDRIHGCRADERMRLAVGILDAVIGFLDPVFHAAEGSSANGLLRNAVDSHQRRPAPLGPTRSVPAPMYSEPYASNGRNPDFFIPSSAKRQRFESTPGRLETAANDCKQTYSIRINCVLRFRPWPPHPSQNHHACLCVFSGTESRRQ
jgi:hypothetical protein